jgi:hypothetical protein
MLSSLYYGLLLTHSQILVDPFASTCMLQTSYLHTHTHTHTHTHIHTQTIGLNTAAHTRVHTRTHACTHMYIHTQFLGYPIANDTQYGGSYGAPLAYRTNRQPQPEEQQPQLQPQGGSRVGRRARLQICKAACTTHSVHSAQGEVGRKGVAQVLVGAEV